MVRLIRRRGLPFVEIGGEVIAPAAFRSYRPKPDNISLSRRCGLRLSQFIVSGLPCTNRSPYSLFGEVWTGEDQYDFTAFDRQYEMFRRFAPDGYYNIMIQLDTRPWWKDAHPDLPYDSYAHISELALCEEWKQAAARYLRAFIAYAEEKYGDRIAGYSFCAGLSTEWFDETLYKPEFDRSGSLTEKAWRKLTGDENAPLPTMASMESGETSLRAPSSRDFKFLEMCSNAVADLVCFFAAEAQKTLAHKKPLGLFYGYTDMDNQIYWNTNAYEKAWRSPDIDMLYSPAAYRDSRFFTGVSSYQYTVDSIALHGKLYVHENDHRTDLARFPLESGVILQDCYASFEEWREVFRRELCNVMQKRAAFWWFDFFGGYYNAPEYERELAFQKKIYDQLAEGERHSNSEIAVFIDPMSFNCTKELSRLCSDLGRVSINALLRCGAPFDLYNLSDITLIDKSQYKMYVFLNAFIMPEDIRDYIHSELSDKLTVFLYGAGMARGDSFDVKNTAELCGMTIEEIDSEKPLRADYLGETLGFTKHIRPLFAVKDAAGTQPLARYENGEICAAIKGNAAYCAMAPVPWTLWRDLARRAGVHIYSEQGSGTAICSQFVSAYTTLTEDCVLHMKEDGVYRDVFSGETYETAHKELRYHAKKGRVMLFVREEK